MIELKDLKNRVYEGKECVSFDYFGTAEDSPTYRVSFSQMDEQTWQFVCVNFTANDFELGELSNVQTYTGRFTMPKRGMPLTTVAHAGLRLLYDAYMLEYAEKSSWAADLYQVMQS